MSRLRTIYHNLTHTSSLITNQNIANPFPAHYKNYISTKDKHHSLINQRHNVLCDI